MVEPIGADTGCASYASETERRTNRPPPANAAAAIDGDRWSDAVASSERPAFFSSHLALISEPERAAKAEMISVLVQAGLPTEDACTLVDRGATAEQATEILNLALASPETTHFGRALLATTILAEARAAGGITPLRVRQIYDACRSMVVVRPDGVLARVTTDAPVERLGTPRIAGGTIVAGDLPVGATYDLSSGILRVVGPDLKPGAIAGELGLQKGAVGAALDGVTEALTGLATQIADLIMGLRHEPDETVKGLVDGLAFMPAALARAVLHAPELAAAFRALPRTDQIRVATRLLTSLYLLASGARGATETGSGLGSIGPSLGALRLADTGGLVLVGDDALAVLAAGGRLGIQLAVVAGGASEVAGTALDARAAWRASERVRRGVGDIANARLEDLEPALALAETMGPNELAIVQRQVTERLAAEAAKAPLARLQAVAETARKIGGDIEAATTKALGQRVRSEVEAVRMLPPDSRQLRAVRELRAACDSAGIDIRSVLERPGPPPPRASLSPGARRAMAKIDRGETDIQVGSRAEAEEILSQYPDYVDTGDWGFPMIKTLLRDGKNATFHWDDVFGEDGFLLHPGQDNPHGDLPHLQLHLGDGATVRVFFARESR
jgi:hypothetical protein